MTLDEVIVKMQHYPWYMDGGAGKLSKKFKCTKQIIYDAKDFVRNAKKLVKKITGPKILIVDIETSPLRAFVWSRWKQNVYLDQTISEWFMICWSAKWLLSSEVLSDCLTSKEILDEDDCRITNSLWKLLDEADFVIAHNGKKFDIPKMNSRFILNNLPPTSPYTQIDTKEVSAKNFGFSSNKLDALATYFGIPNKDETDFNLWVSCLKGEVEALKYMQTYNINDVKILEEVYIKLRPWIKAHPNAALYYEDEEQRCCACGSTDVDLVEDKFYYTSVGKYPIYRCKCGALSRGRKTIINKIKNKNTLTSVGK